MMVCHEHHLVPDISVRLIFDRIIYNFSLQKPYSIFAFLQMEIKNVRSYKNETTQTHYFFHLLLFFFSHQYSAPASALTFLVRGSAYSFECSAFHNFSTVITRSIFSFVNHACGMIYQPRCFILGKEPLKLRLIQIAGWRFTYPLLYTY